LSGVLKTVTAAPHDALGAVFLQVGIVAINLTGEPLHDPGSDPVELAPFSTVGPPFPEQPYYNRAAAEVADLNLDIHVDAVTAGGFGLMRWGLPR